MVFCGEGKTGVCGENLSIFLLDIIKDIVVNSLYGESAVSEEVLRQLLVNVVSESEKALIQSSLDGQVDLVGEELCDFLPGGGGGGGYSLIRA